MNIAVSEELPRNRCVVILILPRVCDALREFIVDWIRKMNETRRRGGRGEEREGGNGETDGERKSSACGWFKRAANE